VERILGKDEVGSSNLPSSSTLEYRKSPCNLNGYRGFSLLRSRRKDTQFKQKKRTKPGVKKETLELLAA
ncbi:MAG: hypothetical protein U0N08_05170, partial [Oscillospiraceae bacterium]